MSVLLRIEASRPEYRRVWYKIISTTGEIVESDGQLRFLPAFRGPHELTVYAIGPDRGVSRKSLTFDGA